MQWVKKVAQARSNPSAGNHAVQVSIYIERLNFVYSLILFYLKLKGRYRSGDIEACYGERPNRKFVSHLLRFLLMILGFRLTVLGVGDSVPNYPHVHTRALELTAELTKALIPAFRRDIYYQRLQALLEDADSASSYVCKHVARYTLFPVIREVLVWRQSHLNRNLKPRMQAIMPLSCPIEWRPAMKKHLLGDEIEIVPVQLCLLINFTFKIGLLARFSLALTKRAIANGVGCTKIGGDKTYRMMCEFTDPRALGGRAQNIDYLVNGYQLRPEDVLFYVTPYQERDYFAKIGEIGRKENIVNTLKSRGYGVIYLSELQLPRATFWRLIRFILRLPLKLFHSSGGEYPVGSALFAGFNEYLQFAPLFHQVSADVHISFVTPQGWTSWRSNNGLLTALCRRNGILSASYQNRAFHSHSYEFLFEALDLFLMWGPAWKEFHDPYLMFIKHIEYIGDIYVDDLHGVIAASREGGKTPGNFHQTSIGVITGDIGAPHTIGYNLRLLKTACHIALKHPQVNLLIKPKDPEHWKVFLRDKELLEFTQTLGDRLVMLGDKRHSIERIVILSDMLLVIGFTTPGIDALLSGKRVVYYDETKCADSVYGRIPKLLARDVEDLESLADDAISNTTDYHRIYSEQLDELDPYRDGCASQRIYSLLYNQDERF